MLGNAKLLTAVGLALVGFYAATDEAKASRLNFDQAAFVSSGSKPTSIPIGHAQFCRAHASECGINLKFVEVEPLSNDRWKELLAVNTEVNTTVVPETDAQLYNVQEFWTYPSGFGDCEDYVLAKRKVLIDLGWAPSALLITVVKQANGEGHAVLMVRTDRGDLILDNQDALIRVWNQTPYHFIKRQSQINSGEWVDLYDYRSSQIAALRP